jgi:hypothetical protein
VGTPPLLPINPNTNININGKAKPNNTAEGLLNWASRLAFDMANMAFNWLYGFMKENKFGVKLLVKKNVKKI